jgi:hypothetical protein
MLQVSAIKGCTQINFSHASNFEGCKFLFTSVSYFQCNVYFKIECKYKMNIKWDVFSKRMIKY